MTKYIIKFNIKDYGPVEVECSSLATYSYITALLAERFPEAEWKEMRLIDEEQNSSSTTQ